MAFFYRALWLIRAFFYRFIFSEFGFPGYIGPPTFLLGVRGIHIGRNVRIFPGLRAECHGDGRLIIHDNVSIGQNFHAIAGDDLHVGSGCLISGDVFITDTDHTFMQVDAPVFSQPNKVRATRIGDNCFLGIGTRIQAGTILGNGCIVGANSVVRGVFPPYSMVVGAPARVVKRFNHELGAWERC